MSAAISTIATTQNHRDQAIGTVVDIPIAEHLADILHELPTAPRNHVVQTVKALRRDEWQRLSARYLERINEITGFDMAVSLTSVVDALIATLVRRAMVSAKAPEDWQDLAGVFALGGYGRGEFNPYSDLDLVVLSRDPQIPEWLRSANAELQTLLWDVGFQVGASMRSVSEFDSIISDDFVTATAALEHRPLLAGPDITIAVYDTLQRFRKRRSRQFLNYKLEELQQRRSNVGSSILLMEPNLKTSPGGLRDIQLLRNIAFMLFSSRSLHALRELDTVDVDDVLNIFAANDHLLGLRSLMHFHHGRKHDQFLLADQMRCAQQLGYGGGESFKAVELLLLDHYRKMKFVDQVVRLSVDRVRSLGFLGRIKPLIATRRQLCPGFSVIDGLVYIGERHRLQGDDIAIQVLTMARAAQRRHARISISLQRDIAASLSSKAHLVRRSDSHAARLFMDILNHQGRAAPILRDLHDAKFLSAYLPEFGRITYHMQFDAYHHYTVDEHTLLAIDYFDAIARCDPSIPQLLQQAYALVLRHDLVVLALLLHDVGKYAGRGHVARGELMVGPVAARLGLADEDEDFLRFLVREHVLLSEASRSRDVSDPDFIQELAESLPSLGHLDALYVLTWCDAKAVGPKVLSGWQEALLEECYTRLRAQLEGRIVSMRHHREQLRNAFQEGLGWSAPASDAWMAQMPREYCYQVGSAEEAVLHARLLEDARYHGHAVSHTPQDELWQIVTVMPDRHQLLADIASICSGHGLDIHACRVWVSDDGCAIIAMLATGMIPARWHEEGAWRGIEKALAAARDEEADRQRWLNRRSQMIPPQPTVDSGLEHLQVSVDTHTCENTAVMDILAKDRPGLLATICAVVAEQALRIDFAQVVTMGDMAADVLYVSNEGSGLDDTMAITLQKAIVEAIRSME
ncbi:MAG: hypothetical protein EA401_01640 [Planctomycetota bacterium]|nr:MAG: hypothetical protein EA401_01640 [Planctomycetota bacterium]